MQCEDFTVTVAVMFSLAYTLLLCFVFVVFFLPPLEVVCKITVSGIFFLCIQIL